MQRVACAAAVTLPHMHRRHVDIGRLEPFFEERFDRAGGPGGQNVNKVNTRVTLLLDLEGGDVFTPEEKQRLRQRLARRMAADGRLRVVSQESRSQERN